MCYYSTTLSKDSFRGVKVGEDLTLTPDRGAAHHYAVADTDKKIVCVMDRAEVHIQDFQLGRNFGAVLSEGFRDQHTGRWVLGDEVRALIGKPVTGKFRQGNRGMAADWVEINGIHFHLIHLQPGTKFYTGPKKVRLETKLGMDDPSIVHDHNVEAPTLQRVLDRIAGLCSITR